MTVSTDQTKSNRLILLSIIGIPLTVVLAASWLWFFVARGDIDLIAILGTSNHGALVKPPRPLDEGGLRDSSGTEFVYADLAPQWTFLIPGGASCGADCEGVLYLTRQIHLAMGKESKRIRRFYVSDTAVAATSLDVEGLSDKHPAPDTFQHYLEREQRGLRTLMVPGENFSGLFVEYTQDSSTWYLVDPAGWIMMSYNSGMSYKDVMADLKFLLKNSTE